MHLIIDVGNSEINFALSQQQQLHNFFAIPTKLCRYPNETLLTDIISTKLTTSPTAIVISSVAPSINIFFAQLLQKIYPTTSITFLDYALMSKLLPIRLTSPETVGIDRLVDVYAAQHHFGNGLIVIDMGTATVLNVLNQQGELAGGAISIGFSKLQIALMNSAEGLRNNPIKYFDIPQQFGNNTLDSINYGVFWGYVGLVEGLIQRIRSELAFRPKVIITGGIANVFHSALNPMIDYWQEHLTLEGIQLVAETLYANTPIAHNS